MLSKSEKKWAAFTHLSTLSQYCFPLGNYFLPLVIWASKKEESEYVDYNGKQVLNFQLSILLYSLILGAFTVPVFIVAFVDYIPYFEIMNGNDFVINDFNFGENVGLITSGIIGLFILACLKIVEFFLIIQATVKTANGEKYNYPLTIQFMK
jgi:uncharacterized Tic20 family protein